MHVSGKKWLWSVQRRFAAGMPRQHKHLRMSSALQPVFAVPVLQFRHHLKQECLVLYSFFYSCSLIQISSSSFFRFSPLIAEIFSIGIFSLLFPFVNLILLKSFTC